jgi:prepilin-type N-terminal cleavage/methylation domain-containing protein
MKANRDGFTLVELMIAMIILSVGLLALLGTRALDTRSILRERNIDFAAIYAARRLELLRLKACTQHIDSSEVLMRGTDTVAMNSWKFTGTTDPMGVVDGYRIKMANNYFKAPVGMYGDTRAQSIVTHRTDTLEAAVACTP